MLNMLMTFLFECTNKLTLSEGSVFESTLCTRSFRSLLYGRFSEICSESGSLNDANPLRQYLRLPNIPGQIRSRYSGVDWMALKDGRQNNTLAGSSTE